MGRDDLIRDLASSFGMADTYSSKYEGSKYDSSTGTLYCEGVTIPKHTIDKASEYFQRQTEYYRSRADQSMDAREMFLICMVASNAISMLKDNVKGELT